MFSETAEMAYIYVFLPEFIRQTLGRNSEKSVPFPKGLPVGNHLRNKI